jgi:hypothetical protein
MLIVSLQLLGSTIRYSGQRFSQMLSPLTLFLVLTMCANPTACIEALPGTKSLRSKNIGRKQADCSMGSCQFHIHESRTSQELQPGGLLQLLASHQGVKSAQRISRQVYAVVCDATTAEKLKKHPQVRAVTPVSHTVKMSLPPAIPDKEHSGQMQTQTSTPRIPSLLRGFSTAPNRAAIINNDVKMWSFFSHKATYSSPWWPWIDLFPGTPESGAHFPSPQPPSPVPSTTLRSKSDTGLTTVYVTIAEGFATERTQLIAAWAAEMQDTHVRITAAGRNKVVLVLPASCADEMITHIARKSEVLWIERQSGFETMTMYARKV